MGYGEGDPWPLLTDISNPRAYYPSCIDGCSSKSVLTPMWPLINEVLTGAMSVGLKTVERTLKTLAEKNQVMVDGAGACPVAAAMVGDLNSLTARRGKRMGCVRKWRRVVSVVCSKCIKIDDHNRKFTW